MTNSSNSSGGQSKWHGKPWWTALGVIVAIAGLVIGLGTWLFPRSPDAGTSSSTASRPMETPGSTALSANRATSTSPSSSAQPVPPAAEEVFLSDISERNFIRQPSSPTRGSATIANHAYASSYSYRFTNCGNCTYDVELNLPDAYKRLVGTFGLTDETRHDKVIDGIVYVSIYSSTGVQLLAPAKIEYPSSIPLDVDVSGVTRIRLSVSGGTNAEYPCWCDARFTR